MNMRTRNKLSFQFQKVRLKVRAALSRSGGASISIPKGSIKSRNRMRRASGLRRFQFQKVRLKVVAIVQCRIQHKFQFQKVRLKA